MSYCEFSSQRQRGKQRGWGGSPLAACPASRFWPRLLIQCKWGFHHAAVRRGWVALITRRSASTEPLFSLHSLILLLLCHFFLFLYFVIICPASSSVTVSALICPPRLSPLPSCHHCSRRSNTHFSEQITHVQISVCRLCGVSEDLRCEWSTF